MTHIFFDLDGTLVDSFPGIEFSAKSALTSVLPGRLVPDLRSHIGPPIREAFRCMLDGDDSETVDSLERAFRRSYDQEGWQFTQAYPGVQTVLAALVEWGFTCHVLTNKPLRPTKGILDHLSMTRYFGEIISPDSRAPAFRSKTEAALDARRRMGLLGSETLFVGDSADDAEAAQACGFQFAAVCFGYGKVHSDNQRKVHYRLERFDDLIPITEARRPSL